MSTLESLYTGEFASGVYQLTSRAKPESILAEVAEHGWYGAYVDGDDVIDKATFLAAFAKALGFPSYFGHNWDAFEESITELTWLPASGYVILWDEMAKFADADPEQWNIAYAVLKQAAAYWQERDVPFYVLVRDTRHHGREIPNL